MHKAIFIDKDGTLIPDIPYNVNPALITLAPGAGAALRRFREAGYKLVVISNQAGVARGLFTEDALPPVFERLNALLEPFGVALDAWYYCPHLPDGTVKEYAQQCACRKPGAALLRQAAADLQIDLGASWMIGDIETDSEAGKRAGCRTILIEKPGDPMTPDKLNPQNQPDYLIHSWEAAQAIVAAAPVTAQLSAAEPEEAR